MGRTAKKEKDVYRKVKHSSLGEKADKRKLDPDEERDVQDIIDPLYYENYCGSCIYFDTQDCPYFNNVTELTRWKTDIDCNKFYD